MPGWRAAFRCRHPRERGNRPGGGASKAGEGHLIVSPSTAQLVVTALGAYAGIGGVFAVAFVWRFAGRLDPAARHGTWGFRLLVLPGVMALWPFLLARLAGGAVAPPDEWTAHRAASR